MDDACFEIDIVNVFQRTHAADVHMKEYDVLVLYFTQFFFINNNSICIKVYKSNGS